MHEPITTKSEFLHSIIFAYVTFRDIEHAQCVMRALKMRSGYRWCVSSCFWECCCTRAVRRLNDRLFYGEWMNCSVACEPD